MEKGEGTIGDCVTRQQVASTKRPVEKGGITEQGGHRPWMRSG